MRLSMFRKKLAYEIKEVETIIQNSNYANQEVQAHLYCIAALLRKIMTRLPRFNGFQIPVITGKEKSITLKSLVGRILHYSSFLPGNSKTSTLLEPLKTITILSDKDESLIPWRREIEVMNFILLAKKIAEDDDEILLDLLDNIKENLETVIQSSSVERFDEIEARESLLDFFELTQKMEYENWPSGEIPLFHEQRENIKNIMEITGIQTYEISYNILFQKLFNEWHFTLIGQQFYPYSENF